MSIIYKLKRAIIFALMFVLLVAGNANAEQGIKKGTVQYIRTHEMPGWEPPLFWFTLNGVSNAGKCKIYHGNVIFVMSSQSAYAMILSALASGKEVAVLYDDQKMKSGSQWCLGRHVTLGNPTP